MFTIKFYSAGGYRQIIKEAESFTILHGDDGMAEITLHQKNPADDSRVDIADDGPHGAIRGEGSPPIFYKAIIENSAGRTTEIVVLKPAPGNIPKSMGMPVGVAIGGDPNKYKIA